MPRQPKTKPTPMTEKTTTNVNVGERLHELRRERQLSIRELAQKSSLAINTLSLIENNKTSPSVSTLQQLAFALGVTITAFFETPEPPKSLVFTRFDERPHATFPLGLMEDLGAGLSERPVEPFVVTLEPGARSGPRQIVHTGYEFVYCLEGQIEYEVAGKIYQLTPGDSLLFESPQPHRWKNGEPGTARFLMVLYPTDKRDRSTDQHFEGPN